MDDGTGEGLVRELSEALRKAAHAAKIGVQLLALGTATLILGIIAAITAALGIPWATCDKALPIMWPTGYEKLSPGCWPPFLTWRRCCFCRLPLSRWHGAVSGCWVFTRLCGLHPRLRSWV